MSDLSIAPYIMSLDDPGDLEAPKGSPAWARAIRYRLQRLARESKSKVRDFQAYLRVLEDHQGFQQLENEDGYPFPSLRAFACTRIPFGLGYDPDVILHLQEETRDMLLKEKLQQLEGKDTRQGERADLFDSNKLNRKQRAQKNGVGRSKQRELDYLAGHAPALLEAVQAGEISTHAAYCQARGLPKETPLTTLHRVWRQVPDDDRLRFLVEMLTPNERRALMLGLEEGEAC